MNIDIANHIKIALHVSFFSKCSSWKKIICHEILGKPWEGIGVKMHALYNRNYLYNVDFQSRFQVIKKREDQSTDSLILALSQ